MKERLATKRHDILTALRNAGKKGVTNVDLSQIALRYGGYLGTLYELGYAIKKENLGDGVFNYILVSEPSEPVEEKPKAIDKLLSLVDARGSVSKAQLEALIESVGVSVRYKAGTHQLAN